MKRWIFLFSCLFVSTILFSFEIEKVNEFAFSEFFKQNTLMTNHTIRNDSLFICNQRSFQIYDLSQGNFDLITDYNMQGRIDAMTICDNKVFLTCWAPVRIVCLSISNPLQPEQIAEFSWPFAYISFIAGDYLYSHEAVNGDLYMHVINIHTFEEVAFYPIPNNYNPLRKVNETMALLDLENETWLYDLSDPSMLQVMGHAYLDFRYFPNEFGTINDTILVASSIGEQRSSKFYSIQDPYNWVLLSEITPGTSQYDYEDGIYYSWRRQKSRCYDISDITQPVVLDSFSIVFDCFQGSALEDDTFVLVDYGTMYLFDVSQHTYNLLDTKHNLGRIEQGILFDNSILATAGTNYGFTLWDVSDVLNVNNLDSYCNDTITLYRTPGMDDKYCYVGFDCEHEMINHSIFEIVPEGSATLLHSFLSPNLEEFLGLLTYDGDGNYYTVFNEVLYRYQLTQQNELEVIGSLPLPGVTCASFIFVNPFIYVLTAYMMYVVDPQEMEIIHQNQLAFTPITITYGFYENYLIYSPGFLTYTAIYDITDPTDPSLFGFIDDVGVLAIDAENDLLFIADNIASVFDLTTIDTGILNEISNFQNWTTGSDIVPLKQNNHNYLLYVEETSVAVYEYTTGDVSPQIPEVPSISLFNYPNPFKPSGNRRGPATTISFSLGNELVENVAIEIFNAKGQKVKQLEIGSEEQEVGTFTWDGTDSTNKPVSSGVYLYQLKAGGKALAQKKMMLLK
jgi:hypothetical protein